MNLRINDFVEFKRDGINYRGNVISINNDIIEVKTFEKNEFVIFNDIKIEEIDKIITHTVVCYIKDNDNYLMLYRNKRKEDLNLGKWIGVGGHIEYGESPDEAIIREVKEETNLNLLDYKLRGIIYFYNDNYNEVMHLYTSNKFSGELKESDEGTLKWIKSSDILNLNLWEGDRAFWPLIFDSEEYFEMALYYNNNELVKVQRY